VAGKLKGLADTAVRAADFANKEYERLHKALRHLESKHRNMHARRNDRQNKSKPC
jgi:hypothetical protein